MKFLVVLIVLIVLSIAGYLYYDRSRSQNPEVIESPVYAEFRVDMNVGNREVNLALFGEMASEEDCRERADRVWQKIIDGCKECSMRFASCKADLEPRYRRLFDDTQIYSTYLSFTRGSRFERNGRMVVYGLTADEGEMVCGTTVAEFQKRYEGTVRCVHGRKD